MLNIEQIKKMKKGAPGKAILAVLNAEVRETARKTHFLNLTLGDKTGTIPAKIWDWDNNTNINLGGEILNVDFEFSPFNNAPQVIVRDYARVDKKSLDAGLFIDSLSLEQFSYYRKLLDKLIDKIQDKPLRDFVRFTLIEYYPTFLSSTGAKANHHARLGGLLEHTCHVAMGALGLADAYKNTPKHELIDYDILIAGALLHDLAKIDTYTSENLMLEYSLQGILTSDYDMSPAYVREAYVAAGKPISEKRLLGIQHILVTHHGKELSEKPPSTFSAWLVHAADLSDAHTDKIASNMPEEGPVSKESIWSLGNKIVDERQLR